MYKLWLEVETERNTKTRKGKQKQKRLKKIGTCGNYTWQGGRSYTGVNTGVRGQPPGT